MFAVTAAEFTAEGNANILVNRFIPLWGCPSTLLSDNGLQFCAQLATAVYKLLGINKLTTSAYHPSGNGGVERVNHTMAQMLAMVWMSVTAEIAVTSTSYRTANARLNHYHSMKLLAVARYSGCAPPPVLDICHRTDSQTILNSRYGPTQASLNDARYSGGAPPGLDVCHRGDSPTVTSSRCGTAHAPLNDYHRMKLLAVARYNGGAPPPGLDVCHRGYRPTVTSSSYGAAHARLNDYHKMKLIAVARYSGGARHQVWMYVTVEIVRR